MIKHKDLTMQLFNPSISLLSLAVSAILLQACGHCPDGHPRLNKRQQDVLDKIAEVNGIAKDSLVYPDQSDGSICWTDSLYGVGIGKRGIKVIPAEVGNLGSLNYFNLDSNEIETLPEEFASLDVHKLRVDGNRICNPSEKIAEYLTSHQPEWKSMQRCP